MSEHPVVFPEDKELGHESLHFTLKCAKLGNEKKASSIILMNKFCDGPEEALASFVRFLPSMNYVEKKYSRDNEFSHHRKVYIQYP